MILDKLVRLRFIWNLFKTCLHQKIQRTGKCLPGAAVVKIQNVDHFLHLPQIGEGSPHATNTKMKPNLLAIMKFLWCLLEDLFNIKKKKTHLPKGKTIKMQ